MLTLLTTLLLATSSLAASFAEDVVYRGAYVPARHAAWRHTARLRVEDRPGRFSTCAAVLLEKDVLLTAAHCAPMSRGRIFLDFFPENDPEPTAIELRPGAYDFLPHPAYDPEARPARFDIAVLVFPGRLLPRGYYPANLQTDQQAAAGLEGQRALAVGAGREESGELGDRLSLLEGRIASYEQGGLYMGLEFGKRAGICKGDSGGPVFVMQAGRIYLSGITFWVTFNINEKCGSSVRATTISADIYSWIEGAIAQGRAWLR